MSILGHVSGALLLSRDGYPYDEEQLLAALAEHGAVLEHNCHPARLDPDWPVLKRAARRGVRIALCPDAHSLADLDYVRYGLLFARKAWLEAGQVLNTLTAEEADAWFTARQKKSAPLRSWISSRKAYPQAGVHLDFRNAFQLLAATILAAQCTDERVNQVTPALFARFPDAGQPGARPARRSWSR